jgi:phage-related protein
LVNYQLLSLAYHHVTDTFNKYSEELKAIKAGNLDVSELPTENNIVMILEQLSADIKSMGRDFESIIETMVKKTQKKLRGQFPGVGFQDSINEIVQSAASVIESISSAASIGVLGTVEPTPTNFAESASSIIKSVTKDIGASYSEITAQASSISDEVRSNVESVASHAASVMSELGEAVYSKLPEAPSFAKLGQGVKETEDEVSDSIVGGSEGLKEKVEELKRVVKEEL